MGCEEFKTRCFTSVYGHEIMGSNVQMYRLNGLYMLFQFSSSCLHCIEKKNNFIVICFILYVRRVVHMVFLCTNKRKLYFLSDFFIVFYLSEEELKVFNIIGQMCTFLLRYIQWFICGMYCIALSVNFRTELRNTSS